MSDPDGGDDTPGGGDCSQSATFGGVEIQVSCSAAAQGFECECRQDSTVTTCTSTQAQCTLSQAGDTVSAGCCSFDLADPQGPGGEVVCTNSANLNGTAYRVECLAGDPVRCSCLRDNVEVETCTQSSDECVTNIGGGQIKLACCEF